MITGRNVGKSVPRVDARDKATGRAAFTEDLCPPDALQARIVHSTIAHGYVKSIDCTRAGEVPGVVEIFTCFQVPDRPFTTAGHPYSLDPSHRDVEDRKLLNRHVRYYGDEIAVVVAETELAAATAARLVKAEYEELPFVLETEDAMKEGAPCIHKEYPGNILAHSTMEEGNFEEAIREPGLLCVDKWYTTSSVQHCHLENQICCAYGEGDRLVLLSATQIPHTVCRLVAQALGLDWGKVRVVKPYVGGGFGNKQDLIFEALTGWLSLELGGRPVVLNLPREDTFTSTRVRHAIRFHMKSWVRPNGDLAARQVELYSNQGAYASQGHAIAATSLGFMPQIYPCGAFRGDAYTVYTNRPTGGAMRGYGMPQGTWAMECHTEDIARALGVDSLDYRLAHLMPRGFKDDFTHNENYFDSPRACMQKAAELMDYRNKRREFDRETGPVRHGIGLAPFWYGTGVWPICLEHSSCRMNLSPDGTVQLQVGETEIGQGADTAFSQMAADAVGLGDYRQVHIITTQDTDTTPFGLGAYASRQTYACGFAIAKTGALLREKILDYAHEMTRMSRDTLELQDSCIRRKNDGRCLLTLGELAREAYYSRTHSVHLTAETSAHIETSAYSFGCCCAQVEVDIPMCKVRVERILNVHDCGRLINPQLAEAQVHGGMSMGLGYALSEELLFDPKTGRMLNGNLLDYKLLTTMDHPHLEACFLENPEPTSPYGTKALGEPPTVPIAPAVHNAILQAAGAAPDGAPMSPKALFESFRAAGILED